MTLLTVAQKWNDIGIATIPIGYHAKRPDFTALKRVSSVDHNGRSIWETYQKQLPTKAELKEWFSTNLRNIAIVTGWQNLVILDIDDLALYGVWQMWAKHTRRELLDTYRVKTSRGIHLYYYMQNPPETGLKWPGIDVKAAGGYCLIDPSIHPSGAKYAAIEADIVSVESVESILPAELIQALPERSVNHSPCMVVDHSPFAIRDDKPSAFVKSSRQILDFFPGVIVRSRFVKVRCPLHDDTHASGWIDTERNRYGCLSCRNGSMDVIQFYAELNGIDNKAAILELAR
jgi:hypothetical protein